MAALLSCVGSNERHRYVVRGDSCALSTMHMSLAGDKPQEVRLVVCADRMASSGIRVDLGDACPAKCRNKWRARQAEACP